MRFEAKIIKIGNSRGVIIPKTFLKSLKFKAGDEILVDIKRD